MILNDEQLQIRRVDNGFILSLSFWDKDNDKWVEETCQVFSDPECVIDVVREFTSKKENSKIRGLK